MRIWYEERNAPQSGTEICRVDDLGPGDIREHSFAAETRYPFHLFIYNDEGVLRCYMNRCPHFGIKLNIEPGQFLTPGKHSSCVLITWANSISMMANVLMVRPLAPAWIVFPLPLRMVCPSLLKLISSIMKV